MNSEWPHSLVRAETSLKLQRQLSFVSKIIQSSLWNDRQHFPHNLVYEISTFIFPNPLTLRETVFAELFSGCLAQQERYLLRRESSICELVSPVSKDENNSS